MEWDTSCVDWEDRILSGRSLVPNLPLFTEEADRAERIFNRLRIPDVIGTPRMSEAGGPWLIDIVRALFGSYDPATNRRMIQELFLLVPKKNGKSSAAAAIMVAALILNRRPQAEYLLIAPTKEIATIAFRQAWGIIKCDEELEKLFWPRDHIKMITHRNSGATLQIKAADTDVITGSKSTGILVDETHVFAKKSNAAEVFVEIRGALAARPDGFMMQITTQSKAPPVGVFAKELEIARSVRDGKLSLPRLPVLYELPDRISSNGGWKNKSYWGLVNPNLGRSVDERFLENALTVAEENGPEDMALLASQHFNVQIGTSLAADRWAGADYWDGSADSNLTLDEIIRRSEVVTVGVDGGGLDDLFAAAVIGRDKNTREWLCWTRAWANDIVLDRRKDIVSSLRDFEMDGDLVVISDPSEDARQVADIIERLDQEGLLPAENAVGFDPFGVVAVIEEVQSRGITDEQMAAIRQGAALSPAIWGLERKLKEGTVWHGGSRLMSWVIGNAKAEQRGNATYITKQTAGKAKIDPLIALFNAVILMSRNPEGRGNIDDFIGNVVSVKF